MFLKLQFVKKKFFLKDSFRISRENKKILNLIIIKLTENDKCGFAECVPYKRYGESQKKIFSYLTNNQSKILKLIRHNKLEKIKYLEQLLNQPEENYAEGFKADIIIFFDDDLLLFCVVRCVFDTLRPFWVSVQSFMSVILSLICVHLDL